MLCFLLFLLSFTALLSCRLLNPLCFNYANFNYFTLLTTEPGTSGIFYLYRDAFSFFTTLHLGLPQLKTYTAISLASHTALQLVYYDLMPISLYNATRRSKRPVLKAMCHTLIFLLLCSSGDVELNPGPENP